VAAGGALVSAPKSKREVRQTGADSPVTP